MPSTAPLTTALPHVETDPSALRIVLFGMPDAGKSSLLGALVQATHTQDRVLQGRLNDLTNGMAELWRRVYEDRQRETLEEIIPYPIYFEPYAGAADATPNLGAMIYDCDGRVANELLSQRQSLEKGQAGKLASAITNADAIILTIDASASNEQVETDFREFVRFLRVLQTQRSRDHAVGGLPVCLALSKCDRLVREPIPKDEWQKLIALRQIQVKERFARYLEGNTGPSGAQLAFGSLDLRVYPTAVKQPALTDQPAQPRTPLGVAELFHDCLRAGYQFRQRCRRANQRLKVVVGGATSLLAAAVVMATLLIRSGGPVEKPLVLADKVAQFEAREKPLPDRLTGEHVQRRLAELTELRDNPEFDRLPDDSKMIVNGKLDELHAYLKLREQILQVPPPDKARTLPELDKIRDKLETQAAIPVKYRADWEKAPPPAVVDRNRRLQMCQALREGVEQLKIFWAVLKNKANGPLFDSEFRASWEDQVNAIFENEAHPPFSRGDTAKGAAYDFEEAGAVEKEWQAVRKKLRDVRDLALALGATRNQPGPEAVLLVSANADDASSLNSLCAAHLERLQKLYPEWKNWSLAALPDAVQGEIRKRLKRSYDDMIRDGQRLILARLRQARPSGDSTPQEWRELGAWLLTPALRDWRDLFGIVAKLLDPTRENPIDAAAQFLRNDSFDMQLRALTVEIPNSLPQGAMQPGETMTVSLRPQGSNPVPTTLRFRIDKKATEETARAKKYRFALDEGDGRLIYKPGDEFGANLPLLKNGKNWEFIWSSGAAAFAFDCLARDPNLREAGAALGSTADGVVVTVDGRFPSVPALLPSARRERP